MLPDLTLHVDARESGMFRLASDPIHEPGIKMVPGARYRGGGRNYWAVPAQYYAAVQLRTVYGDAVKFSPEAAAIVTERYNATIGKSKAVRESVTPEMVAKFQSLAHGFTPKGFQVTGVMHLGNIQRCGLFDEQGTGKMVQASLALAMYQQLPALVVAPSGVIYAWQRHLTVVGLNAMVLDGSDDAAKRRKLIDMFETEEGQVLVTTYSMLAKHSRLAGYGTMKLSDEHKTPKELNRIAWRTIVADECHRITDPKSQQTRAAWALREDAECRWLLSGTPVEQSPLQLWTLLHMMDPDEHPSSVKYRDRYVETTEDFFGKVTVLGLKESTRDEFHLLNDWRILRREVKDVLPELPDAVYETYEYTMPSKLAAVYNGITSGSPVKMPDGTILETFSGGERWIRQLQSSAAALSVVSMWNEQEGTVVQDVTMVEPCPKLDALDEFLAGEPDDVPYVVWFVNRDLMAMAEARMTKVGRAYTVIHGDKTPDERDEAVRAFQAGEVQFILCQTQAASEGTTMTRAHTALILQQDPSFIRTSQLEGRTLRIGSEIHDSIRYVRFVARGTVEQDLALKIEHKQGISDELFADLVEGA